MAFFCGLCMFRIERPSGPAACTYIHDLLLLRQLKAYLTYMHLLLLLKIFNPKVSDFRSASLDNSARFFFDND
jgi:hypothetical protein